MGRSQMEMKYCLRGHVCISVNISLRAGCSSLRGSEWQETDVRVATRAFCRYSKDVISDSESTGDVLVPIDMCLRVQSGRMQSMQASCPASISVEDPSLLLRIFASTLGGLSIQHTTGPAQSSKISE